MSAGKTILRVDSGRSRAMVIVPIAKAVVGTLKPSAGDMAEFVIEGRSKKRGQQGPEKVRLLGFFSPKRSTSKRRAPNSADLLHKQLAIDPVPAVQAPVARRGGYTSYVENMIEEAQEVRYTEVWHVYRNRDEIKLGEDRVLTSTLHAESLDQAVKKLITIAGFDAIEAKAFGLDAYEAGTVMDLCDRLQVLTGDTFEVCPYEMPIEED